jgi:hypothetical protein
MSYFIFLKNYDNIQGSIYRIAENESDLNNLNIEKSIYKIINVSQTDFDDVKYGLKAIEKYNNDNVVILNNPDISTTKNELQIYIQNFKRSIEQFINSNKNHVLFNVWNNYYNQLNNLNLDSIQYPLNKSLEQYFKDQNLPSLNPLQLP